MSALLWYRDQAFSVSNSVKDLLYEIAVAVANRDSSMAHERLTQDGRLIGCYGVSGMGFPLEAFEEAFGGMRTWQEAMTRHAVVVLALCTSPECRRIIQKVLVWIWFLLGGGRFDVAAGRYPDLEALPETPGTEAPSGANIPVAIRNGRPDSEDAEPSLATKFLIGSAIGGFVGTLVGVATILAGLANNWLIIPAWMFSGALLGTAHPLAEAVLQLIIRIFDRPR
jgi:hypothetical protein